MTLEQWAMPRLAKLLPLDEPDLQQVLSYTNALPPMQAAEHLAGLLGDSAQAVDFISSYTEFRDDLNANQSGYVSGGPIGVNAHVGTYEPPLYPPPTKGMGNGDHKQAGDIKHGGDSMFHAGGGAASAQQTSIGGTANDSSQAPAYAPPLYPPPSKGMGNGDLKQTDDIKHGGDSMFHAGGGAASAPQTSSGGTGNNSSQAPTYAPPTSAPPAASRAAARNHTNQVIEAAKIRARDEQEMQNMLQSLQYQYKIYNPEIEPEHEADYYCNCPVHFYQRRKWQRYGVQDAWSKAVMYPGEKAYNDNYQTTVFNTNQYRMRVCTPYGVFQNQWSSWGVKRPVPKWHAQMIHQTIELNNSLNKQAQNSIDAAEPKFSVWDDKPIEQAMSNLSMGDKKTPIQVAGDEKRGSLSTAASTSTDKGKSSKLSSFRKSIGIKSSEERQISKAIKAVDKGLSLRDQIVAEERGRWPDEQWRQIVATYQEKVGMARWITDLRTRKPIQYLHLLRAGYFEPIPVAWATQNSNPLKFSIEAASGWRGITPAWRGYEDTAEERLYWVLNHREGSVGMRMKPDFISEMNMARARMATAVEPPPEYYSANDECHLQHTSAGYSKQVMPPPFHAFDRPEVPTDDTMILLDVSGSMDFDPVKPVYDQYLITKYTGSTQPKNKFVAKAIIRRFAAAMEQHDHAFTGYDLITFSDRANYIGTINHQNLEAMWRKVAVGGGTRVMTGWQRVKELHFQKHSQSATHHPVYGWQAGPETPMLRLLLLLDGEASDMDEFELDLLGLSWAHVTIFLIGVDGCPHHHRHANELQRISDVNHHVSFVDAQGNTPERFVTHELLKRHLGYEISMQEFVELETPPAYTAVAPGQ